MKKKILAGIIVVALIAAIVIVIISLAGNSKEKEQNNVQNPSGKPTCAHDDPSQIEIKKAVEPSCMGLGLTEGKKCNKCGTMIVPQTLIPEIDCIEGEWTVELEPTETEDGYECTRCVMCFEVINERIIPAGSGN